MLVIINKIKNAGLILLTVLILTSCDCMQLLNGVVVDKETRQPLDNVAIGQYKKEDPNQPYSKRFYSDSTGQFGYHSISGGLLGCPDLELYFSKVGYKTSKQSFKSYTQFDTIYLEKVK
jgi:hypothetical protein